MYVYIYIYIYVYTKREREREREIVPIMNFHGETLTNSYNELFMDEFP